MLCVEFDEWNINEIVWNAVSRLSRTEEHSALALELGSGRGCSEGMMEESAQGK